MIDTDFTVTLSFILAIATIVYTWWRTRDQNTDARFKSVDLKFKDGSERMDRHESRLNSMEQTMRDMPKVQDMHSLQLTMSQMNGKLDVMAAVIDGNSKVMVRLEAAVDKQDGYLHEVRK